MTSEQFAYWMQGFAEMVNERPTEKQWTMIKDHLTLVFDKQTPDRKEEVESKIRKQDIQLIRNSWSSGIRIC
jgi:hypothetical protein